ncbi:MAG: hypothetical protein WBG32_08565 [Nodosilinea sp.]
MKISKQTRQLADRLQQVSPKPLTQRQAVRRAMWLQAQTRVLEEQLADYHQPPEAPTAGGAE